VAIIDKSELTRAKIAQKISNGKSIEIVTVNHHFASALPIPQKENSATNEKHDPGQRERDEASWYKVSEASYAYTIDNLRWSSLAFAVPTYYRELVSVAL
jgi:hypothetical protein